MWVSCGKSNLLNINLLVMMIISKYSRHIMWIKCINNKIAKKAFFMVE